MLSKYQKFQFLFDDIQEFDPKNVELIMNMIDKLNQCREKIDNMSANVEVFPMFEVHCYKILSLYRQRINEMVQFILTSVQEDAQASMEQLTADWEVSFSCETLFIAASIRSTTPTHFYLYGSLSLLV